MARTTKSINVYSRNRLCNDLDAECDLEDT
jgi:hypothetical protein